MVDRSRCEQFRSSLWHGIAPGGDPLDSDRAYVMVIREVHGMTRVRQVVRWAIDDHMAKFGQADGKDR